MDLEWGGADLLGHACGNLVRVGTRRLKYSICMYGLFARSRRQGQGRKDKVKPAMRLTGLQGRGGKDKVARTRSQGQGQTGFNSERKLTHTQTFKFIFQNSRDN